ncbi:MAG: hypothetical protein V1837_05075 [Candidatus Woesearchaeota archaeon]
MNLEELMTRYNINNQDVLKLSRLDNNAHKMLLVAELLNVHGLKSYSSLELGLIAYFPESDPKTVRKRTSGELSHLFSHKRSILHELNMPYAQYIRMITGTPTTNMQELLGYTLADAELQKNGEPSCTFAPSIHDWHRNTRIPFPINKETSFILGILWRAGSITEVLPGQVRTRIYCGNSQKLDLEQEALPMLNKAFNANFRWKDCDLVFNYGNGDVFYSGAMLEIGSLAMGTFLNQTIGLPFGGIYDSNRTELPKVGFDRAAFLKGYALLMPSTRGRWYTGTRELSVQIATLLCQEGVNAKAAGRVEEHCYVITTDRML